MGGRRKKNLILREGIFIIGEGLTEQYYFHHLKQIKKYNCIVKPRFFGNTNITQIEKTVENLLQGYVTVICVFDADVSKRNEVERRKFEKFKRKYTNTKRVIICDTLPSIEYWFLLHFLDTNKSFTSSRKVLQELKKYIPNYEKTEKFLEKSKWIKEFVNKLEVACKNAKKDIPGSGNSYSNIYKAIAKLKSLK